MSPSLILPGETEAIQHVLTAAARFGYGNMINELRNAWCEHLIDCGLNEITAIHHSGAQDYKPRDRSKGEGTRMVR